MDDLCPDRGGELEHAFQACQIAASIRGGGVGEGKEKEGNPWPVSCRTREQVFGRFVWLAAPHRMQFFRHSDKKTKPNSRQRMRKEKPKVNPCCCTPVDWHRKKLVYCSAVQSLSRVFIRASSADPNPL